LPDSFKKNACTNLTYVFELCSPYNKVVRYYPEPGEIFLLSIFDEFGYELSSYWVGKISRELGIRTPGYTPFIGMTKESALETIYNSLQAKESSDPTFEGYVLRDSSYNRIKVKNKTYVALHQLKNNGQINKRRVIELILREGVEETLIYLPELQSVFGPVQEKIEWLIRDCEAIYKDIKDIDNQKDFAFCANHHSFSGILYNMRKCNCSAREFLTNHLSYAEKLIYG